MEGRGTVNPPPGTPFHVDFNELLFVSMALMLTEISVDCYRSWSLLCASADHLRNSACTTEKGRSDNEIQDAYLITEYNSLTRSLLLPDWLPLKYNSRAIERWSPPPKNHVTWGRISCDLNLPRSESGSMQLKWKAIHWNQLEKFNLDLGNLSPTRYSCQLQYCKQATTHKSDTTPLYRCE